MVNESLSPSLFLAISLAPTKARMIYICQFVFFSSSSKQTNCVNCLFGHIHYTLTPDEDIHHRRQD